MPPWHPIFPIISDCRQRGPPSPLAASLFVGLQFVLSVNLSFDRYRQTDRQTDRRKQSHNRGKNVISDEVTGLDRAKLQSLAGVESVLQATYPTVRSALSAMHGALLISLH